MAKGNRKKKANGPLYFERKFLRSKAFRSLNGTAKDVLFEFHMRKTMKRLNGQSGREDSWTITNNGEIVFSYNKAEEIGFSRSTFMRAIDKLVAVGFIDISCSGGGMIGDCSLYAISERWRKFDTDEFEKKQRPKDTRGMGISKDNWKVRCKQAKEKKRNEKEKK
jgi:hypothetical protein